MPVILFCQCGDRVDIKLWNVRRAQLQCFTCGHEAWLEGFTVSEFNSAKLLESALVDQGGSIAGARLTTCSAFRNSAILLSVEHADSGATALDAMA